MYTEEKTSYWTRLAVLCSVLGFSACSGASSANGAQMVESSDDQVNTDTVVLPDSEPTDQEVGPTRQPVSRFLHDGAQPTPAYETFLSAQPGLVISGQVTNVSEAYILWGELGNYEGAYLQARLTLVTVTDEAIQGTWYQQEEVEELLACGVSVVTPPKNGGRYAVGIEFVDVVDASNNPHPDYYLEGVGTETGARYLPPEGLSVGDSLLMGLVRTVGLSDQGELVDGDNIGIAIGFRMMDGQTKTYSGQVLTDTVIQDHMLKAFAAIRAQITSVFGECLGWDQGSSEPPPGAE